MMHRFWKNLFPIIDHLSSPNRSASRIELSRTDVKVLVPSRLVLGGGLLCLSGVHARPAPSLQKNFCEDENLFFRSVTGLANLGIGSGTLH